MKVNQQESNNLHNPEDFAASEEHLCKEGATMCDKCLDKYGIEK